VPGRAPSRSDGVATKSDAPAVVARSADGAHSPPNGCSNESRFCRSSITEAERQRERLPPLKLDSEFFIQVAEGRGFE
jgi:hypothetical protein